MLSGRTRPSVVHCLLLFRVVISCEVTVCRLIRKLDPCNSSDNKSGPMSVIVLVQSHWC